MDPVRLQNYLQTLQISPATCLGFEDEAFAACWTLTRYAFLKDSPRAAWLRAITTAAYGRSGSLSAKGDKSHFYTSVLHRKNSAFGIQEQPRPEGTLDVAAYPWALDDPPFDALKTKASSGAGFADLKQISWSDLSQLADDKAKQIGLTSPIAVGAGFYLRKAVTIYVPELAGMLSWEVTVPMGMAGFAALQVRIGPSGLRTHKFVRRPE